MGTDDPQIPDDGEAPPQQVTLTKDYYIDKERGSIIIVCFDLVGQMWDSRFQKFLLFDFFTLPLADKAAQITGGGGYETRKVVTYKTRKWDTYNT